jgi:uncharacterized membrane-anchored protein YjiN (DUF445 family)
MLALFLVARDLKALYPELGIVEAFAEAALIGGLADWFAVTALFRRPLGLPIPHTAIIPSNKGRIAQNLSEFIVRNFFGNSSQVLTGALSGSRLGPPIDVASALSDWLLLSSNRAKALAASATLLGKEGGAISKALSKTIGELAYQKLESADVPLVLADTLEALFTGEEQRAVFSDTLELARGFVTHHHEFIESVFFGAVPWFIPNFVTQRVASGAGQRIARTLQEMQNSFDHPARIKLRSGMASLIASLRTDPQMQSQMSTLRDKALRNPALAAYVISLAERGGSQWLKDLASPESKTLQSADQFLSDLAKQLSSDKELRSTLNAVAQSMVAAAAGPQGEKLQSYIQETILGWNPHLLVEKLELQVGRDLQFIRMNGTLVGGLVGTVLYLLKGLL